MVMKVSDPHLLYSGGASEKRTIAFRWFPAESFVEDLCDSLRAHIEERQRVLLKNSLGEVDFDEERIGLTVRAAHAQLVLDVDGSGELRFADFTDEAVERMLCTLAADPRFELIR